MDSFTVKLFWKDRQQLAVLLVWACLVALPIGRAVEVPVMLMALAGLYLLVKHWHSWRANPAFRLFACVFLLAWIPILISLVDAVRPQSTTMMSVNHLRFAFSGIFILHVLSTPLAHRRFPALCAWLLLFWLADGMIQMAAGRDLFGFAAAVVIATVIVILAAGARSAWITVTVVMLAYCVVLWHRRSRASFSAGGRPGRRWRYRRRGFLGRLRAL
ncbi:MAG: hypothetical protein E4H18_03130 [Hyphomicrobiales bacterium]|nr:MAG: hypothetical protein E4H18_03130 [Hyphomicrobiales bacterium]